MQVCRNLLEGAELKPLFDVYYAVCMDELVVAMHSDHLISIGRNGDCRFAEPSNDGAPLRPGVIPLFSGQRLGIAGFEGQHATGL
ncbi:hypothetical protein IWX64_003238 [Arthrobacter sp. CAN_A212]